ncbi:hypothetical protein LSH36_16g04019 [Paralvinella palmiformis]|uniref:LRRCT domain-containing protein n=1 Tax=Paralvinella palmiformis TaxID=53620 RepID=A0AAD9KC59_9ANNE|nr:hypothetical protein LSH36_16g04019 [Paralvinella palmiformis]
MALLVVYSCCLFLAQAAYATAFSEGNLEWCSHQCTCLNNYRTVDCARRMLDHVPSLSNLTVNLYLDNNRIERIAPETFQTLGNLMMLNMEKNAIRTAAASYFCSLQNLQILNLGSNKLEAFLIPDNLTADCKLPSLKQLILSNNRLSALPPNLPNFTPSLKLLNVSFNTIRSVSFNGSFSMLMSLRVLDLRGNQIHQIMADDFAGLKAIPLNTLSLSECGIVHIEPEAFHEMTELASLSLSRNLIGYNTLEAIFTAIGNDSQLVQLDLSEMFLQNVTASLLGMLKRLSILDIFESSVHYVEPGLFDLLPELESLNVGHNELHELENVGALKQLRWLNAEWNHLTELDLTDLDALQSIDVSGNQLKMLPGGWLGAKENLQLLNVSHNMITSIHPEAFAGLSLQQLDLSHNWLSTLNDTGLQRLRKLNLSHNRLSVITPQLFTNVADTLEDVDLSHNNISNFQQAPFKDFISLQELNLAYNRLGRALGEGLLCDIFSSMGHLQQVDLSANEIVQISAGQWQHLHHVNTVALSYNHIKRLGDASVIELTAVARLVMDYNDLSAVDVDVLDKMDYLEEADFGNNPFACTPCVALPFLRWLNHSTVRILGKADRQRYQCYMPPEFAGQYLLDYHPTIPDADCKPHRERHRSQLDWTMIAVAVAGVVVFIILVTVLFFYTQICQKIKSLHYRWQIRYREVSGVEFTNDPKV